MKKILIAIDGPSSSGKSTIAKNLSKYYNIPYLNTGSLYRALAFLLLENKIDIEKTDEIIGLTTKINNFNFKSNKIHNEEIGKLASIIAQKPEVRKALFNFQIDFKNNSLEKYHGAILEGRDIGTVICPDADFKFFIILDIKVRAQRRLTQLQKLNSKIKYEDVLADLEKRDYNDKYRKYAPLKKAKDAIIIDNSQAPEITLKQILKIIND